MLTGSVQLILIEISYGWVELEGGEGERPVGVKKRKTVLSIIYGAYCDYETPDLKKSFPDSFFFQKALFAFCVADGIRGRVNQKPQK